MERLFHPGEEPTCSLICRSEMYVMVQEDSKVEKEILCKWLVIFIHGKKVLACPFALETCGLIHVFHFHFK